MKLLQAAAVIGAITESQLTEFEKRFLAQIGSARAAFINSNLRDNRMCWNVRISGGVNLSTYIKIDEGLKQHGWQIWDCKQETDYSLFTITYR